MRRSLARSLTAVLVLFAILMQASYVLAGTTGGISGVLTDTAGTPVAAARVSAVSPSQQATVTTDSSGRFSFVSLAPDTYTLSFEKQGYQAGSQAGVTVQADQNVTVNLSASRALQNIGRTASRANSALVRPGQTASEYSVTPAQQAAAATLGGGTNLNSAYSAIAAVPGVLVPLGNAGWGQSIFIRGGDYTQTGNEVDGIPINRSFDQYASGQLSSLGNQEIQVYTGQAPADAQAVGLAGFVNQVIKTGTYPGNISATIGVGTPAQYNHGNFEVAGASPNRLFSYYAGTGGYNQDFRVIDQFNGAGFLASHGLGTTYNYIAANCGTAHPTVGCYQNSSPFLGGAPLGPNGFAQSDNLWGFQTNLNDRETIANIHLGIPHKNDGNHDDVQLLYDYGNTKNYPNDSMDAWGSSLNDVVNGTVGNIGYVTAADGTPSCPAPAIGGTYLGGPTTCAPGVTPAYRDQNQYTGPVNAPLTTANQNSVINYAFANSPAGRIYGAPVDFARQDGETSAFAIVKAQYQHNIADKGYVRLYGYSLYSDRLDNGIVGLYQSFTGVFSSDYQISSHSRGVVLNSGYQLSSQHLLNFNVGYVTSNTVRYRNDVAAGNGESRVAYLLDSSNPTEGCYSGAGVLVSCSSAAAAGYSLPGVNSAPGPLHPSTATSPLLGSESALTCGGGPCQYYAVNDGRFAADNTVVPKFLNASIGDTWKPTAKLSIDASLRSDTFSYDMRNTSTLGNELFVNSYNATHCVSGTTLVSRALNAACPAGTSPATLNASSPDLTYANILQPRVGATYSLDPFNVFRASYGRFVQPPQTSAVQATNIQAGTPSTLFYQDFGFNSFVRPVTPEVSFNTDFSWEHQVKGSDVSTRLTPFYRKTQNEFATVLVDPKTNFVASVNGQNRTASGIELAVNKGDFARDGVAASLSYTYTHAVNHYKVFSNGGSFVNGINTSIQAYNAYTKAGGGAPCYTPAPVGGSGSADPTCAAGSIANPYYNAPLQSLLDPNGAYSAYNQEPGFGSGTSTSYVVPHVASLLVQYKRGPLRVIPSLQFEAGARYGSPVSIGGVAPDTCAALAGNPSAVNDPRYAGTGTTAGAGYDASSCTGIVNIPNPYTGKFDGIGQFVQPNLLNANLQLSYDLSKRLTLQVTGANLFSTCWGGSNVPWAIGGRLGCSYAAGTPAGNFYNPGDVIQNGYQYPYVPILAGSLQAVSSASASPPEFFIELKMSHL
jgi:hypothetical protein